MIKLEKIVGGALIGLASLLPIKSQAEDFYVSTPAELKVALSANNSSAQVNNIFVEPGFYDTFTTTTSALTLENENVIGINPVVEDIPLTERDGVKPPKEGAYFNWGFILKNNATLQNVLAEFVMLHDDGEPNYVLRNAHIKDCYLMRDDFATVYSRGDNNQNVTLENNVIMNTNGNAVSIAYCCNEPLFLRGNVIANSKCGVFCQSTARLEAGTEQIRGENVFFMNDKNIVLQAPEQTRSADLENLAEWNYWYNEFGNRLQTPQEIAGTIGYFQVPTRNAASDLIDFEPFYTSQPFQQRAMFSDTQTADSQSGNWNGILIWDEHDGLVGWKNGFGNVSMPYELSPNRWKWLNFYDFGFGGWVDQTVNYRNKVATNRVSASKSTNLVGTTQGYNVESDDFHYVCIQDMETGFNDVKFGSGNWTVDVPKSNSFTAIGIYDPKFQGWTDAVYTK